MSATNSPVEILTEEIFHQRLEILQDCMHAEAKNQNFESAEMIKQQIAALRKQYDIQQVTQEAAKASLRRAKSSPPAFIASAAEQLPPHKPKENRSRTAVGQVPMKSLQSQNEKINADVPALAKLLDDVPHLKRIIINCRLITVCKGLSVEKTSMFSKAIKTPCTLFLFDQFFVEKYDQVAGPSKGSSKHGIVKENLAVLTPHHKIGGVKCDKKDTRNLILENRRSFLLEPGKECFFNGKTEVLNTVREHIFEHSIFRFQNGSERGKQPNSQAHSWASDIMKLMSFMKSKLEKGKNITVSAFNGDLMAIKEYISYDESLLNARNIRQQTSIYCAARNGHYKVVEFLLECKADPNKQQEVGSTPLHAAAFHGHFETFCLLLKNGANSEIVNYHGRTALQEMERHKPLDFARYGRMQREQAERDAQFLKNMSSAKAEWMAEKADLLAQLKAARNTIAELKREIELKDLSLDHGISSANSRRLKKRKSKSKIAFQNSDEV